MTTTTALAIVIAFAAVAATCAALAARERRLRIEEIENYTARIDQLECEHLTQRTQLADRDFELEAARRATVAQMLRAEGTTLHGITSADPLEEPSICAAVRQEIG